MPSSKDLRRRIRSIKNTAQITKAMEMVAATKMRRAQTQALGGRPYNQALRSILDQLLQGSITHPLLQPTASANQTVILLTTDKSLCGALNTNLFRLCSALPESTEFITIGIKGRNFIARTNRHLIADFLNVDQIDESLPKQIRTLTTTQFLNQETGLVSIVFPNFVSTLTQTPISISLLPINPSKFLNFLESITKHPLVNEQRTMNNEQKQANYSLIEPNLNSILEYALNHFLEVTIYQALLETKASEHSARMIAMQNATQNAKDLVSDLTLTYNQIRQDAITNELLEITSAGLALE